ncbi:hypothetical protein D3C76_1515620 [compost metagenome]
MQVFQQVGEFVGQVFGIIAGQARCEQGEFSAAAARGQPVHVAAPLLQVDQQLADITDQGIGALAAEALVEPGQVVDPQQ